VLVDTDVFSAPRSRLDRSPLLRGLRDGPAVPSDRRCGRSGRALIAPIKRSRYYGSAVLAAISFRAAALIRRFVLTGAAAGATPSLENCRWWRPRQRGVAGSMDRADQVIAILRLRPRPTSAWPSQPSSFELRR
jgi:hypothetical protein